MVLDLSQRPHASGIVATEDLIFGSHEDQRSEARLMWSEGQTSLQGFLLAVACGATIKVYGCDLDGYWRRVTEIQSSSVSLIELGVLPNLS